MASCHHIQVPFAEVSAGCDALAWSRLLCRNCGQHVTPCIACSSPCAFPRGRGSCVRCGVLNPGNADADARRVLGLPSGSGLSSDLVRRMQEALFGRRTHALFELQDYAALRLSLLPRTELKRKRGAATSPTRPIQSPLASQSTPSTSVPFLGHNATAQSPIRDPSASPACFIGGDSPGSIPGVHPATREARACAVRLGAVLNCLHCRATLEEDLGQGFGCHSLPICSALCSHSLGHRKRSQVLGSVDSCRLSSMSLTTLRMTTLGVPPEERDSLLVAVESMMEGSRDARQPGQALNMYEKDRGAKGRKGGSVAALLTEKVKRQEQQDATTNAHCQSVLLRINVILGTLLTSAQSLCALWEHESEMVERLRTHYRLWMSIYHFVFHFKEKFCEGTKGRWSIDNVVAV